MAAYEVDACDRILENLESNNIRRNEEIFHKVLDKFFSKINSDIIFSDDSKSYCDKVISLKDDYIYDSQYVKLFFEILKRHGYFMRQEIKDAIHDLGLLKNPNENSDIIKKYLNSPVIQDISFDGTSKFTIDSERYGRFVFELASYLYRKDKDIKEYIETKKLPNRCHIHAYFLSQIFPDFYAITSLCRYYFKGGYFHSYTLDKESGLIIDLCSNAVLSKDSFDFLFKPREISVVLNSEVRDQHRIVLMKSHQLQLRCELLKIALYKEYLRNIRYKGEFEEGPSSVILHK